MLRYYKNVYNVLFQVILMDKTMCPNCKKPKKTWFNLCYDCNKLEKEKPSCEVCGIEVPEDHTLCKKHWREKKTGERKIKQIELHMIIGG